MKNHIEAIGEFLPGGIPAVVNTHGQCASTEDTLILGTLESGEPVVRSNKTGKVFKMSWTDICSVAILAGVSVCPLETH